MTTAHLRFGALLVILGLAFGCSGGGGGGGGVAVSANSAPVVQFDMAPSGVNSGPVTFTVVLRDGDDDPLDLVLEYSQDGTSFFGLTLNPSASLTGLAADADGETYSFTWDTAADGVGVTSLVTDLRLRATASDPTDSASIVGDPFAVDNTVPTSPALTNVTPTQGPGGTVVTVSGFNFGNDPTVVTVTFGGRAGLILNLNTSSTPGPSGLPSTLLALTPAEVGNGPVEVSVAGTTLTGPDFHGAPRVTAVMPARVTELAGETLELFGAELADGAVLVSFTAGPVTEMVTPMSVNATSILVAFPDVITSGGSGLPVQIQVLHDGGPSNTVGITVLPAGGSDMPPAVTRLEMPLDCLASRIPLEVFVHDAGGTDLADLSLSFSLDGGTFQPLTLATPAPTLDGLAASPVGPGLRYRLQWDSATDVGTNFEGQVRIQAVASENGSGTPGVTWTTPPLAVDGTAASPLLIEDFSTNDNELVAATTADWNDSRGTLYGFAGELVGLADGAEAPWGNGSDGDFHPVTSVTLQTDGIDPVYGGLDGVFRFSGFTLDPGIVVNPAGTHPLDIRVDGTVVIRGTIDVSGGPGSAGTITSSGSGGIGLAGGTNGGAGGIVDANGNAIDGSPAEAGGGAGVTSVSVHSGAVGGGGAGGGASSSAQGGATGAGLGSGSGGTGGVARGLDDRAHATFSGAGGGGGGGRVDGSGAPAGGGGGGGAGGGTVLITASENIVLGGIVRADGGSGGDGFTTGSGGGGSGGLVGIRTPLEIIFEDGVDLSARGGPGGTSMATGGSGSDGRITLETPVPLILPGASLPFDLDAVTPGPGDVGFSVGGYTPGSFDPGTGIDGSFAPIANVVLVTDGVDPIWGGVDGEFQFDSILIPSGVNVTAMGSNPLILRSTGDIDILGSITVAGGDAPIPPILPPTPGDGGVGGPGAGDGGAGGFYDFVNGVAIPGGDGQPPTVLGPGEPNPGGFGAATVGIIEPDPPGPMSSAGGGGGAGHTLVGDAGTSGNAPAGTPGGIGGAQSGASDFRDPADVDSVVLQAGAGGAGGGGNRNDSGIFGNGTPGAGGGGGGGALHLVAGNRMTLAASALIDANGGYGAASNITDLAGNGGGGAGGAVLLQALELEILGGTIEALGGGSSPTAGTPGGFGANGRIRLESGSSPVSGTLDPAPLIRAFDGTIQESVAFSSPLPVGRDGFIRFTSRIVATMVTPALQTAPTEIEVLWGVWQAPPADPWAPEQFSGYTSDPSTLPPGEFIQFQVLIYSATSPAAPGSLDALQAQTGD